MRQPGISSFIFYAELKNKKRVAMPFSAIFFLFLEIRIIFIVFFKEVCKYTVVYVSP